MDTSNHNVFANKISPRLFSGVVAVYEATYREGGGERIVLRFTLLWKWNLNDELLYTI